MWAAEQSGQGRFDAGDIAGLAEIEIGAVPHPLADVFIALPRAQENNRDRIEFLLLAQPPAQLPAVHLGHMHIQHDQVRAEIGGHRQSFDRRLYRENRVLIPEAPPQELRDNRFIIDDEDSGSHSGRSIYLSNPHG